MSNELECTGEMRWLCCETRRAVTVIAVTVTVIAVTVARLDSSSMQLHHVQTVNALAPQHTALRGHHRGCNSPAICFSKP